MAKTKLQPRAFVGRAFRQLPPVLKRDRELTALRELNEFSRFVHRQPSFMRLLYTAIRESRIAGSTTQTWGEYSGFNLNKFSVRELAQRAGVKVPEIYGQWDSLDDVDWASLPEAFVLKTFTGYGKHGVVPLIRNEETWRIAASEQEGTLDELLANLRQKLESGKVSAPIYAEELLDNGSRFGLASDFKVYSFYGQPALVFIREIDNFYGAKLDNKSGYFDLGGNRIDTPPRFTDANNVPALPKLWAEGLATAAEISMHTRLPFVRVDLYEHQGEIYFGELTPRPGHPSVFPLGDSWDEYLGNLWEHAQVRVQADLVLGNINPAGHVIRSGSTPIPDHLRVPPTKGSPQNEGNK